MKYKFKKRRKKKIFFKIFLILILFGIGYLGVNLFKRYSFSSERVNLEEYLGVKGEQVAIYLNDKLQNASNSEINYIGFVNEDSVYLPLSFVKAHINDRFYYAKDIEKILYCLPDEIVSFGDFDIHQIGNAPYIIFKEEPYLLVDYVKDFSNIRYDKYIFEENKRVYIYSDWDKENLAYIKSKEAARLLGGNKSPIVVDLKKGEEVKILEKMTKWVKVKTASGYIGYIRKSKINREYSKIPVSTYVEQIRTGKRLNAKPCIGFHYTANLTASKSISHLFKDTKGMNVISPTWFSITNNEGNIRSLANPSYVQTCHAKGIQVWAVVNNIDGVGKDDPPLDEELIFSNTKTRRKMIDKILREINVNYLDGINLDIEAISKEAGEHYIQFVRELSIELTKIGCILSVDTFIPYNYNKHYYIQELNDFCDYVVVMCYDEHNSGSEKSGSVSSINFLKEGISLSLESVDKDKLVIALPFYSRIWTTSLSGDLKVETYPSETCESSAKKRGINFAFDETTCQNYGKKTAADGSIVECWLEDDLSLAYKMNEIKSAGLGGTAAWRLTFERPNFFNIIDMNRVE